MAIKSIQRQNTDPTAGLPLLGFINKGGERTQAMIDAHKPGPDLEYFRFAPASDKFSWLIAHVERIYGHKPTFLDPVLILGRTPDEAFPNWREERGMNGQRVVRRCDEEKTVMWIDEKGNLHNALTNPNETPIDCRGGNTKGKSGCDKCVYSAHLNIFLPQLYRETKQYGYWRMHTGSQLDISSISAALQHWFDYGNLEVVSFRLGREMRHVSWRSYTDKQSGATKVTEQKKSLLYLDLSAASAPQIQAKMDERQALMLPSGINQIGAPAISTETPIADADLDPEVIAVADEIIDGDFTEQEDTPKDLSGAFAKPAPAVVITPITTAAPVTPVVSAVPVVATPPHWAADKANRDRVIFAFREYGVTDDLPVVMEKLEKGVTKLSESKTTSVDAYIALIAAAYPKQPVPATAPETTPVKPKEPAAVLDTGYWTPEHIAAFDLELTETYPGILISDVFEALGTTGWALSIEQERKMVAEAAKDEGWVVVSKRVAYHKGESKAKSYFLFSTPIGDILHFAGTTKMIELTGQGYARSNDIEHWRDLSQPREIEPIGLKWSKKQRETDQSEYFVLESVQPTSRLEEILEGEPL